MLLLKNNNSFSFFSRIPLRGFPLELPGLFPLRRSAGSVLRGLQGQPRSRRGGCLKRVSSFRFSLKPIGLKRQGLVVVVVEMKGELMQFK